MKAMLESTSKIIDLVVPPLADDGRTAVVQCRIWEGVTEGGVKFHAYIVRVAADATQDLVEFDRELSETKAPTAEIAAIPLRMIL